MIGNLLDPPPRGDGLRIYAVSSYSIAFLQVSKKAWNVYCLVRRGCSFLNSCSLAACWRLRNYWQNSKVGRRSDRCATTGRFIEHVVRCDHGEVSSYSAEPNFQVAALVAAYGGRLAVVLLARCGSSTSRRRAAHPKKPSYPIQYIKAKRLSSELLEFEPKFGQRLKFFCTYILQLDSIIVFLLIFAIIALSFSTPSVSLRGACRFADLNFATS